MKNVQKIMIVFIGFLIFYPVAPGHSENGLSESLSCGEGVYYATQYSDPHNLEIDGINLAAHEYIEVHYDVLVNSKTLFVSGRMKPNKIVLAAITLDTQKSAVIAEYPIEGIFPIEEVKFMVFVMHQLEPPNVYVVATYTNNESGMHVELISTVLEVFRVESDDKYTLINKEQVDEIDIGDGENTDPQFIYKHLAAMYTPKEAESGTIKPATRNVTTVFPGDVNQDGYPDILVWRQIYLSKKIEDPGEEDYVFDREELHVMYFQSQERGFSPLTLLRTSLKHEK